MSVQAITLGPVASFPEGEGVRVELEEFPVPIAVFNLDGEFYALPDSCPHKGAPFSRCGTTPKEAGDLGTRGKLDPEELSVTCPWHGMKFDLTTGDSPATGYRVRPFEVTVDGDQVVLER